MKYFTTVNDIGNVKQLIRDAIQLKSSPLSFHTLGKNKTLGLIFMNPSLRTRLSTQKAAFNLGMNVIVMNIDKEGWALETLDGAVMNGNKAEHIKDAAAMMGLYCDIIGVRCFPTLMNPQEDYSEHILLQFMRYSKVPLISLESATLHPLQSLADMITIEENKATKKPKVVLTWAPHIKALPQAVPNSFSEWALRCKYDLTIACPEGYELHSDFTRGATISHHQAEALENADFVYVKNWSSFREYGKVLPVQESWQLSKIKLSLTNNARIMHCLPVRRNVELPDDILDGTHSLIHQQALNRVFAAQAVLKNMLETLSVHTQPTLTENYHA
jgi:N-succinyl-L-ornithine transcarbamylase